MGFIAIKNKKVCPFNNDDEKYEILDSFYDEECLGQVEIFNNNELEKALKYANVRKVSGYSLFYDMSNYEKLMQMKKSGFTKKDPSKENRYYELYISENHGNCFSFMLNDLYYLNTNKFLIWANNDLEGKTSTCSEDDLVQNFEDSILCYAKETHQDLEIAAYQYLVTFKRIYGSYPWSILNKGTFKKVDDKIEFSETYKIIGNEKEGILKKYSKYGPIQIYDHSICEISKAYSDIKRQLRNEDLLDFIRRINWHY